jgi:hypothetical protein
MELRKHPCVVADLVFDMGKAIVMSNDKGKFDKAPTESKTTEHRAENRTGDRS